MILGISSRGSSESDLISSGKSSVIASSTSSTSSSSSSKIALNKSKSGLSFKYIYVSSMISGNTYNKKLNKLVNKHCLCFQFL